MMKYILFIACLFFCNVSLAQIQPPPELKPRYDSSIMCHFPPQATPPFDIKKYMEKNCHYPDSARKAGIQGRVAIQFVVNEKGAITNVTVVRGIGYGCDEEAMRLIKKMPPWKPAKEGRKAIKTTMIQVVRFSME